MSIFINLIFSEKYEVQLITFFFLVLSMGFIHKRNKEYFLVSNDTILSCNLENGSDKHLKVSDLVLPGNVTTGQIQPTKRGSRTITSIEFSNSEDLIVISTEDKQVIVFDKSFQVIRNFITNRVANKVCFTLSNDIVVADKTGDVFLFKINQDSVESVLLLGHRSIILDLILSECGKYIITCDRDEKIRVSHFPNCYNIASFCLGHSEFVTSIKLVGSMLVSASGDGTVRLWNFIQGEQLDIINTNKYIEESNLLEKFAEKIDKDNVEISALPITDMQIYVADKLYLALSIYSYNAIQLYCTNLENVAITYITKFVIINPYQFYLSDYLYVFSKKVTTCNYSNNHVSEVDLGILENFFQKYKDVINIVEKDSIYSLYKRKFDNVQEYLERKKQRIQIK